MFTPNGAINEMNVEDFEKVIGFSLPTDYRDFLVEKNGGVFADALIKPEVPGELLIDCLFGLGLPDQLSLEFWHDEFKSEIPENSLIIGSDAGGGFLLLCTEVGSSPVYYYDHSYLFSSSCDDQNTYLISKSFSELLMQLNSSNVA